MARGFLSDVVALGVAVLLLLGWALRRVFELGLGDFFLYLLSWVAAGCWWRVLWSFWVVVVGF